MIILKDTTKNWYEEITCPDCMSQMKIFANDVKWSDSFFI